MSALSEAEPPYILVVDDEPAVANVLARGLRTAGWEAITLHSGDEALIQIAQGLEDDGPRIAALLTDIHMPRLRGDILQRQARDLDPELAVLLMTAADESKCAIECLKDGVYDYLTKPLDIADLIVRVEKALERRRLIQENRSYQLNLEERVTQQATALQRTMRGSMEALIHALEAKDTNTRFHSARVSSRAASLAVRLAPGDSLFVERVRLAALFHDIGKIGVSEALLNKPGPLTVAEAETIRHHVETGVTILEPILDAETIEMVRSHHEYWNGKGYPRGLTGEAIPLGGRIVAVADAYDAMASPRPYRSALSPWQIERVFREGAGVQWDPAVVAALWAQTEDERASLLRAA